MIITSLCLLCDYNQAIASCRISYINLQWLPRWQVAVKWKPTKCTLPAALSLNFAVGMHVSLCIIDLTRMKMYVLD